MRLVEKKCPNCKAGLKFNDGDTTVKCEYCGSTYHIEKDEKKAVNLDINSAQFDKAFKLVGDVAKPMIGAFAVTQIIGVVMAIFVFVFIAFVGFNIFSQVSENIDSQGVFGASNNKDGITDVSQIDDVSLDIFEDESIATLKAWSGSTRIYQKQGDWTRVGIYLLIPKSTGFVELHDVYKITYVGNGNTIDVYAGVSYKGLELSEDGEVVGNYIGFPENSKYVLEEGVSEYTYGYASLEDYYNKVIRSEKGSFNIKASEGMYLGKN